MKKITKQAYIGQRLFEYLLLVNPDSIVNDKIRVIKTIFTEKYGCKQAAAKPHLTMINFVQFESEEFRIVNCFDKFAKTIYPFDVVLDGFAHFDTHTIYAKLHSSYEMENLVKMMRNKFRALLEASASLKPKFTIQPHLTIAHGMNDAQFEMAWEVWKNEHFLQSFKVQQMILIKRELNPKDLMPIGHYKPVQDFMFGGTPKEEQLMLVF